MQQQQQYEQINTDPTQKDHSGFAGEPEKAQILMNGSTTEKSKTDV